MPAPFVNAPSSSILVDLKRNKQSAVKFSAHLINLPDGFDAKLIHVLSMPCLRSLVYPNPMY